MHARNLRTTFLADSSIVPLAQKVEWSGKKFAHSPVSAGNAAGVDEPLALVFIHFVAMSVSGN